MPGTFIYEHPEGKGLGQHHAEEDLAGRPAQPAAEIAALQGMLEMVSPTGEQREKLAAFTSRTMADLDMPHGTVVTHIGHDDDRNLELVSWTDKHGDTRTTSLTPEIFASHFRKAG